MAPKRQEDHRALRGAVAASFFLALTAAVAVVVSQSGGKPVEMDQQEVSCPCPPLPHAPFSASLEAVGLLLSLLLTCPGSFGLGFRDWVGAVCRKARVTARDSHWNEWRRGASQQTFLLTVCPPCLLRS